jgi:hypothetical protein
MEGGTYFVQKKREEKPRQHFRGSDSHRMHRQLLRDSPLRRGAFRERRVKTRGGEAT